jgi:hypothetical protein
VLVTALAKVVDLLVRKCPSKLAAKRERERKEAKGRAEEEKEEEQVGGGGEGARKRASGCLWYAFATIAVVG